MPRGRRRFPWIKLWFDILNDVKINRLSATEKWCWAGILLLAGQSPIRGKLLLTETEPMTMDDIADALRLTIEERTALEGCVSKMTALNSLAWNSHCLEVVNFKKRQEVYQSDLPESEPPNKLRINSELTPIEGEGRGKRKDVDERRKSTPPKGSARKKRADPQADPRVKEVFNEIHAFFGYPDKSQQDPIPNYGKEGQFIKKMLGRGFTCVEILACWRSKVSQRGGEFVSMGWVNEDIGKKGGAGGVDKRHPGSGPPSPEKARASLRGAKRNE